MKNLHMGKTRKTIARYLGGTIAGAMLIFGQMPAYAAGEADLASRIIAAPEQAVSIASTNGVILDANQQALLSEMAQAGNAQGIEALLIRMQPVVAQVPAPSAPVPASAITTPATIGAQPVVLGVAAAGAAVGLVALVSNRSKNDSTPTPLDNRPSCTAVTSTAQLSDCKPGTATFNTTLAEGMRTDAEFQFSNTSLVRRNAESTSSAEKIKAHIAHGYGFTGKGITLGIIDAGFNVVGAKKTVEEIVRNSSGEALLDDNKEPITQQVVVTTTVDHVDLAGQVTSVDAVAERRNDDHGSNVAALAIGKRHGDGQTGGQGVAYDAKAVVSNINTADVRFPDVFSDMATVSKATVSSNSYGFGALSDLTDEVRKEYLSEKNEIQFDRFEAFMTDQKLTGNPAKAISLLFSGGDVFNLDDTVKTPSTDAGRETFWNNTIAAFRTFQTANDNRGVIAWANSNNGTSDRIKQLRATTDGAAMDAAPTNDPEKLAVGLDNVDIASGAPLIFPELKGQWITVVNVVDKGVYDQNLQFNKGFDADTGESTGTIFADDLPAAQKDLIVSKNGTTADGSTNYTGRYLISAPCGSAAEFCVSMDGGQVTAAGSGESGAQATNDENGEFVPQLGTSQATPQVAAAVALLQQAFPNLSGKDIVTRLFATSDNSWFKADKELTLDHGLKHGISKIWGHGFIDLEKALAPIGATTVIVASGQAFTTNNGGSTIRLSRAFGSDTATALNAAQFTVQDLTQAEFTTSVGSYTIDDTSPFVDDVLSNWSSIRTERTHQLGKGVEIAFRSKDAIAQDRDLDGDSWRFSSETAAGRTMVGAGDTLDGAMGFSATPTTNPLAVTARSDDAFDIALFSLADDDQYWGSISRKRKNGSRFDLGVFSSSDDDLNTYGFAANHAFRPTDNVEVIGTGGLVMEEGGMLGTKMSGAFENGTAMSLFGRAGMKIDLGNGFEAKGAYTIARTTTEGTMGLFADLSPVLSDSFAFGLEKHKVIGPNDHLALTFSQPLRVMSADAQFNLPTGIDASGLMGYSSSSVDLAPEGRELRLTASYATPVGDNAALDLGFAAVKDAGHTKRSDLDFGVFLGFNVKF